MANDQFSMADKRQKQMLYGFDFNLLAFIGH
jgi:hypothetical protein